MFVNEKLTECFNENMVSGTKWWLVVQHVLGGT